MLAVLFLSAWFVNMLIPIVFGVSWEYGRCLGLILLARIILPSQGQTAPKEEPVEEPVELAK